MSCEIPGNAFWHQDAHSSMNPIMKLLSMQLTLQLRNLVDVCSQCVNKLQVQICVFLIYGLTNKSSDRRPCCEIILRYGFGKKRHQSIKASS